MDAREPFTMTSKQRAMAAIGVILDEAEHFLAFDRLERPSIAEEVLDRLTRDLPEHAKALGSYFEATSPKSAPEPYCLEGHPEYVAGCPHCDDKAGVSR